MTISVPIYVQIQEFVRQGISKGHFREGDRLPSEQELAERFDTTRATVARALQQLVFERVISRRSGSGTFVSPKRIEDHVDTTPLESFEDHVLAAGETLEYCLLSFEPVKADDEVAKGLGVAEGASVWRLDRLRIVDGRVAALEQRHLPEAVSKAIRREWLSADTIQNVLRECLGLRIGRMENAVSAALAGASDAKQLQIKRGEALLVRTHTIYDVQGRALLHGKTLYPGEFSIRYTLRSALT